MASSGSGSRKGFPEAGGKHCKPQGQEDMLSLKGHRSDCIAFLLKNTHSVKLKTGARLQVPF